ncbi:MAG: alpha/beta fold hydrolase [Candidatus Micrarchaeia archaeon]
MQENYFFSKGEKFIFYQNAQTSFYKLLLLHGYSFNSDVWDLINLPELLGKNRFGAYAFDIPGFPVSRNKKKTSNKEIVDLLYELYSKISSKKITILGSSAGSYFAARFAERFPELVNGLILVGPVKLEAIKFDKIKAPIFAIWGSKDDVSDPIEGEKILKAHNAKTWIIEDAPHACYLKNPKEFNHIVLDIMESIKKENPIPYSYDSKIGSKI